MNEGHRHAVISADDHGPLLTMITWFLGCTLILCTATRLGIRFARHLPTADDLFILAAAVLAIGGTIATSFAVDSGFGKKSSLLTTAAIEAIQRNIYTTTVLYVLTVGVSKVSITTFLGRLACTPFHKTSVIFLCGLIICWTITFTTAVLFECAMPHPWAVFGGKCISMLPFWLIASMIDAVTDLVMIFLPIQIVSSLQLPPRKKAVVICIFALRTLLIILSMTRIVFVDRAIHGDPSFDGIPYAIATQTHSTLSVIVACSPALKPLMDSVRTGMLSASLAKRGVGTTFGQDSWGVQRSNASHSTLWGSTSHRRPSIRVCSSDNDAMYDSEAHGRLISTLKTETPPMPILQISRPVRQLSSGSRKGSPPRPPPPPEELRPDLTCFQPRLLGINSTVISSSSKWNGQSGENREGIITKTRQWEVRIEGGCI